MSLFITDCIFPHFTQIQTHTHTRKIDRRTDTQIPEDPQKKYPFLEVNILDPLYHSTNVQYLKETRFRPPQSEPVPARIF